VTKETSGILLNNVHPPRTAQGHHVHADASFWKVCVEKLAAQSVANLRIPQYRGCSHMELVKHNEMCRQVRRRCVAAEVICSQPRLWTAVEHVGFVRVITNASEVRFTRQKFHRDVMMNIAAQNIHW